MRAIGIILAGGNNSRMRELSDKRAIAAMPVAGSYRSIDFALSNMANSHIQKVAVLTQYNARSLNEHLSSSKWWDFGRKQGGLFVFTPTITKDNSLWYQGTADAIYQNIDFLKQSHEPYVVIASGDCIYRMDYNKVLEYHIAKRADITVVCTTCEDQTEVERFGVVRMNDDGRIVEFEEKPIVSSYNTISTGIYVVRRRQLIAGAIFLPWKHIIVPTWLSCVRISATISSDRSRRSRPRSMTFHQLNTIRGQLLRTVLFQVVRSSMESSRILFCLRMSM